ncbi:MAG: Holliday junction resolvase RuvX [Thermotogota bacterium]|nr:Holliday junction resolvase RuvX [Thermotogota bacterium]
MKILGIDYGTRRIGIAISVEAVEMPLKTITIENYKEKIKEIVNAREIDTVVVGLPVSMSGRYNEITLKVVSFALKVSELVNKPVWLFDERLSTESSRFAASSRKSFNNNKDALSALNILRRFNPRSSNASKIVDAFPEWIPEWEKLPESKLLVYQPDNPEIVYLLNEKHKDKKIFTSDPQIFLLLKRKGFSPVNIIKDVYPEEYSSIVINRENQENCPENLKDEKNIYTYRVCARSSMD